MGTALISKPLKMMAMLFGQIDSQGCWFGVRWVLKARLYLILSCLISFFSPCASQALDAIPLFEPISIGALIRSANPTAGISSATALNAQGDTVGRAVIDNHYKAFVFTELQGVSFLPPLNGFARHVAVDITDRDGDGRVIIVGSAQTLYGDPDRAVLWVYDTLNGVVLETVDIGVLPGADWSTATAVNNKGLVVGYSRANGWMTPYQPMVYDFRTRALHLLSLPFNPININNYDVVTGGTHRASLIDDGLSIAVGSIEDLNTAERPSVTRTTGLNDFNDVIGVTSMGYTDGAGRMVVGAVRYVDPGPWEVIWANSAYDSANGINIYGDVVGSIGVSSAIRPFLFIEELGQGFLINDLTDPALPTVYADYGANAINANGWIAAGASGAVLFKRIGDMPAPRAPENLTAVPHEPTWQQPWNAITLNWENTSDFTKSYTVERSISGANDWMAIKQAWPNLQLWDTTGALGVTYDYRVRAQGIAGLSEPSAIATAQFPSQPVDETPPTATFSAPADGAEVSGNVAVVAEFSDNQGLEYVEISVAPSNARALICSQSPGGATEITLNCSWNTKRLALGNYTLTAYAYDALGNWISQSITLTLIDGGGKGGGGGGKPK